MADTNNVAQYTEEAVGAGHPSKAQVVDRHSTACHDDFGRHKWVDGGNVASASSISVPDDANYFTVTGTTTITAIAATTAGSTAIDTGVVVKVKFSGTLTLTNNDTSFILPQGYDLSISAGDFCEFIHLGSGNWACLSYNGFATTDQAYRNLLDNGSFLVWQRGTTFDATTTPANSDDNYTADGWILLSDGNDIVDVTRGTNVAEGSGYSLEATVQTVSKKFGFLHAITNKDAFEIIGDVASLSFDAKVASAAAGRLDNVKAVVLSWSSTSDAITSDVVSAWNAEDTTPTWAANWTAENTPVNLAVTDTMTRYTINNISIDTASAANVAVFIWADGLTGTGGDVLSLARVKLNKGVSASKYIAPSYTETLHACQARFFRAVTGNSKIVGMGGQSSNNTSGSLEISFPSQMISTPILTISSAAHFLCQIVGTNRTPSAIILGQTGTSMCAIQATYTATGAVGDVMLMVTASASATLDFDADL